MKISERFINGLSARIYVPKEVKKVLVAVHGFAGDKESSVICELGEILPKQGIAVVSFDLPSHGGSNNTQPLQLDSCFKALKDICAYALKTFKQKSVSFFATSFGAFLLLNFLQKSKLVSDTIILRAPGINMTKSFEDVLKHHGKTLVDLKEGNQNLGFEQPLMVPYSFYESLLKHNIFVNFKNTSDRFYNIIQGKKDELIDYKCVSEFFERTCKTNYKIFFFENADHRFKNAGEFEKIVKITKKLLS